MIAKKDIHSLSFNKGFRLKPAINKENYLLEGKLTRWVMPR
jgi:hypothetical protein